MADTTPPPLPEDTPPTVPPPLPPSEPPVPQHRGSKRLGTGDGDGEKLSSEQPPVKKTCKYGGGRGKRNGGGARKGDKVQGLNNHEDNGSLREPTAEEVEDGELEDSDDSSSAAVKDTYLVIEKKGRGGRRGSVTMHTCTATTRRDSLTNSSSSAVLPVPGIGNRSIVASSTVNSLSGGEQAKSEGDAAIKKDQLQLDNSKEERAEEMEKGIIKYIQLLKCLWWQVLTFFFF